MTNPEKIQYWRGSVMMGLVSEEDAQEIMNNARSGGLQVYDHGHFFVIEVGD